MARFRYDRGEWQRPVFLALFVGMLLAGLVALTLQLHELYLNRSPESIVSRFQSVLAERYNRVRRLELGIARAIAGLSPEEIVTVTLTPEQKAILAQEEAEVFLARGDSVLFWSTTYSPSTWWMLKEGSTTYRLNGVWYWVLRDTLPDGLAGAVLLKLHTDYPIGNRYLQFNWARSLRFLSGRGSPELYRLAPSLESACANNTPQPGNDFITLWFVLLLLSMCVAPIPSLSRWRFPAVMLAVCIILGLRVLLQLTHVCVGTFGLLFEPTLFASSNFIPSLGDFLLHCLCVLVCVFLLARLGTLDATKRSLLYDLTHWLWLALGTVLIFQIHTLCRELVFNSTFNLTPYFLANLSPYAFVAYLALAILASVGFYCLLKAFQGLVHRPWQFALVPWLIVLSICITSYLLDIERFPWVNLSLAVLSTLVAYLTARHTVRTHMFTGYISAVTLLLTLFASLSIDYYHQVKELNIQRNTAELQCNERDPLAEFALLNVSSRLAKDQTVRTLLRPPDPNLSYIAKYLTGRYLSDYLTNYDCTLSVSYQPGEMERLLGQNEATPIEGTDFFSLDGQDNRVNYVGLFPFNIGGEHEYIYLRVLLESKLPHLFWGYPELLQNEQFVRSLPSRDYSTAVYHDGRLIAQQGGYIYPLELEVYGKLKPAKEQIVISEGKYAHYIFHRKVSIRMRGNAGESGGRAPDTITTIVTQPRLALIDVIGGHAYMFFIFEVVLLLVFHLCHAMPIRSTVRVGLSGRIQRFILVTSLALIALAVTGILYIGNSTARSLENRNMHQSLARARSAVINLLQNQNDLSNDSQDRINWELASIANQLHCDINLYSLDGWLMGSSRPAIFSNRLLGERMVNGAWCKLSASKRDYVLLDERIGSMRYASIYAPLIINNRYFAYINIPHFTSPDESQRTILSFISILTGIAALLFALLLFVVLLFTTRILKPLRELQQSVENLSINSLNAPIHYSQDDEIGHLVNSYNRMLEALQASTQQLAQNERQLAWREMARQIAHDIKTPLTPIKLSLQYLISRPDRFSPSWHERFDRFAVTLNDQIDNLSRTASSFSNFASLTEGNIEELDLNEAIEGAVRIFQAHENIHFDLQLGQSEGYVVFFDPTNFRRMLNNLISNAVQAIGNTSEGTVRITTSPSSPMQVCVAISDTGGGISESMQDKIFRFNFTTKNSGSGLGLSIVKTIVEAANGTIDFTVTPGEGTTFFIRIPCRQ